MRKKSVVTQKIKREEAVLHSYIHMGKDRYYSQNNKHDIKISNPDGERKINKMTKKEKQDWKHGNELLTTAGDRSRSFNHWYSIMTYCAHMLNKLTGHGININVSKIRAQAF